MEIDVDFPGGARVDAHQADADLIAVIGIAHGLTAVHQEPLGPVPGRHGHLRWFLRAEFLPHTRHFHRGHSSGPEARGRPRLGPRDQDPAGDPIAGRLPREVPDSRDPGGRAMHCQEAFGTPTHVRDRQQSAGSDGGVTGRSTSQSAPKCRILARIATGHGGSSSSFVTNDTAQTRVAALKCIQS